MTARGCLSAAPLGAFLVAWTLFTWTPPCGALRGGTPVQAQQDTAVGSIRGRVVDRESGKPLDFANVVVLGTTMGAMARHGGSFVIQCVPVGACRVKASFVGYETQTTDVRVEADKATLLEFRLRESDVVSLAKYGNDADGDARDEFFPVNDPNDPSVFWERRLFRIGMSFEF